MTKRQRRAELSNEEDSRAPRKTSKMRKHDSTDHLTEGSSKTNKVRLFISEVELLCLFISYGEQLSGQLRLKPRLFRKRVLFITL